MKDCRTFLCRSHRVAVRLWDDVGGSVEFAGYILMATILGIGMLVGIASYRDQVVQEFGDIAISLESLDQSYSFEIGDKVYKFKDKGTDSIDDPEGQAPAGISLNEPASEEKAEKGGNQP